MPVYLARVFRGLAAGRNRCPPVGLALAAVAGRRERLSVGDQGGDDEVGDDHRHRVLDLKRICAVGSGPLCGSPAVRVSR